MSTRKIRSGALLASLVLASGACLLGGCGGVRNNLTPELSTLNERGVDVSNRVALTFNTDWRELRSDMARFTLTDRPTRLAPEPVPH